MTHVIYKYTLSDRYSRVQMPRQAKVLSCQIQNHLPTLWMLVNTDELNEWRSFVGYVTGEQIDNPQDKKHLATLQIGEYVVHIFEDLVG